MIANLSHDFVNSDRLKNLPRTLLTPIPPGLLQPLLQRMLRKVVTANPDLFDRLGSHKSKRFLIDPTNMHFVLILQPDPENLRITALRRRSNPGYDARIAGTFLTMLDMIDGKLDGDALFFSRDLVIEGDTEAVVCLRNALDDLDGSIADDIASVLGRPGNIALSVLRNIRKK